MHKDFSQWGYSRVAVTPTQLKWAHYHTDNSLVDHVVLPARPW